MDKKSCVVKTLKIIGSKWTILILFELCGGTKRFGQLQKNLSGISTKTLSERLKQLERGGVVTKKIYPEIPPRVEYSLTKKGESLKDIIDKMQEWGEREERSTIGI